MLQITSYTPSWLSHPAPGARIFSDPEQKTPPSPTKRRLVTTQPSTATTVTTGPRQLIAHRGAEVFTVVGNKIRWSDLTRVRSSWEARSNQQQASSKDENSYRTLTTSIYYEITSICVSPSGHFLAITTEHAVWVAFLPDSARLQESDNSSIKLKTLQIGRTTHVIGEAALASVLWHPYAVATVSSDCLITVTVDAAVRLWEFHRTHSLSFDRPALALDLEKLSSATSISSNVEPKAFGRSRGFSVDAFDFEVASACFGGRGFEHEDPWASMTLWVAMTNSDVYALCPLLPQYWQPTTTTVPSLTTSTMAEVAGLTDEDDTAFRAAAQERYTWMQELDGEDTINPESGESVLGRPTKQSHIPRLQGPFEVANTEVDELDEAEICDIHVIPANMDEDDLFSGEEDYEILGSAKSLPFTVVCLTTTENQLYVLLELGGVSAEWLPQTQQHSFSVPHSSSNEYVLLQSLSLGTGNLDACPRFSADTSRPYIFYVTTNTHTHAVSLEEWAARVGSEVSDDVVDGLESRLKLACQGSICQLQEVLTFPEDQPESSAPSTAVVVQDAALGSILLSTQNGRAIAAQLGSLPSNTISAGLGASTATPSGNSAFRASQTLIKALQDENEREVVPVRAPYAPARSFYADQHTTANHIKSRIPAHKMSMLTETPLRLSPACLDVVTVAHRAFSQQTSSIEKAAAELFRRCLRLQEELVEQVKAMADLAVRVKDSNDRSSDDGLTPQNSHQERIEAAKLRQLNLVKRYETIRRKAGQGAQKHRELSVSERAWVEDINSLADRVGDTTKKSNTDDTSTLSARTERARRLQSELLSAAKSIKSSADSNLDQSSRSSSTTRPSGFATASGMNRFQKEMIQEVMKMVERESNIIEAVETRLSRLKFS